MSRFRHIKPDLAAAPEVPAEDGYGFEHYQRLADEALHRGAYERALRYYGRALEQDRTQPAGWLGQVEALLRMGQPEEAATWMEQAAAIIGEVPTLLALRAVAAARSGALDDARAWSDRALRQGPDVPAVWLSRAEVLYGAKSTKMARANLNKAHERGAGPQTALRCGEVALEANDLAGARPWLERAARDEPDNPVTALRMGVYWARAGDTQRARVELERALELEPRMQSARLALDDLNARRGLWHHLKAAFQSWRLS